MRKKHLAFYVSIALLSIAITSVSAMAASFMLGGEEARVLGYITQGLNYGWHDEYDTKKGVKNALTTIFAEGAWSSHPVSVYMSGKLNVDWTYQIYDNNDEWNDKLFSESKSNLNIDDEYWQLLNEMHVTVTPGNVKARLGKQLVVWGQTDFFRLMDQINPQDNRRGFSDVEFADTLIPIWLATAEYHAPTLIGPVEDLGIQFVFNPNADFIPDQSPKLGNDEGGVWAPNLEVPLGGPYPFDYARLGSSPTTLEEPEEWDEEGFEYGVKLEGVVYDALFTLNGFYGRENAPVLLPAGPPTTTIASDGRMLFHAPMQGYYARQKFAGFTASRHLPFLRISSLGGVAPTLNLESIYVFDGVFTTADAVNPTIGESDEIRWAATLDWKWKIPFLNERNFISFGAQYTQRILLDYPEAEINGLKDFNEIATLSARTTYFNEKLMPVVYWMHDITNEADYIKCQLTYTHNSNWSYILGANFLGGREKGAGFEAFENKDEAFFKITYQWD